MNRILDVQLTAVRLDPHEAEIWVAVTADHVSPTTEVRGRFVGPKSPIRTTIELAYPLRPLPKKTSDATNLTVRAVIPEPSLWKPESPFVYDVVVELWEENTRCDLRRIDGYAIRR